MKTIVLGVTGGIAAYKAPMIARELIKNGFNVVTLMTENATNFVTKLSMETVTGNRCYIKSFDPDREYEVEHIALTKRADAFLVAPATANVIGKIAAGIADDLLTTTIMAAKPGIPVVFAPAMNENMFENIIVQDNIEKLKKLGYEFIEPAVGHLACGDSGKGRMADIPDLVSTMEYVTYSDKDFADKHILVTAGPTIEMIDPVRFLTNRSSGKMGFAIAKAAKQRGAKVTLVCGPTELRPLIGIDYIPVKTTEEMMQACDSVFENVDYVIKAAAPVDFKPEVVFEQKIKKYSDGMDLHLIKNTDILMNLGKKKKHQKLIGFAAETNNIEEYAKKKMEQKNLDMIVANDINGGNGFGGDFNSVTIYSEKTKHDFSGTKLQVGHEILNMIKEI